MHFCFITDLIGCMDHNTILNDITSKHFFRSAMSRINVIGEPAVSSMLRRYYQGGDDARDDAHNDNK